MFKVYKPVASLREKTHNTTICLGRVSGMASFPKMELTAAEASSGSL